MTAKAAVKTQPLALCYVRVSTSGQVEQGASLEAQKATLVTEAKSRGWAYELIGDEGLSAKNMNRPGLQSALERLDRGQADYLLAVRLDRVSRSVADFAGLLDRARKRGWGLVLLSPNIDTSDPAGRFTGNVLASAAQYERELIGARTREGMAQRKSEGVKMGRPRTMDPSVIDRIARERQAGKNLSAIAEALTAEGVPTTRGGKRWYASTVKAALAGRREAST